MGDTNTHKVLKTGPWSEAEKIVLRSTIASGGTVRAVAMAFGRSKSSVSSMASDLGLRSMQRVPSPTRERIRDLVAAGWAPSRIAKRLRVDLDVVAYFTLKASA